MKKVYFLLITICLIGFSSCKILYPGMMFQQKDYQVFELKDKLIEEYVIKPGDDLTLTFVTRDGEALIDRYMGPNGQSNNNNRTQSNQSNLVYRVKPDGFVDIPFLGDFYVQGYTTITLKEVLENELGRLYVDPYAIITVQNRRVFLFKGYKGEVVSLNQTPTHLIEVLAKSGGIEKNLKAYNIKIIRGDLKNPTIFQVDISTINGLINSDIILQSNDIVYIEPRRNVFTDSIREVTSNLSVLLSLVSSILLITRLVK
jgi:polysaccharide export outer membrane protein